MWFYRRVIRLPCINIFSLEITIEEMFVLTQASFSQKKKTSDRVPNGNRTHNLLITEEACVNTTISSNIKLVC